MVFKLSKPVMALAVFEPDHAALNQWQTADIGFDPFKLLVDDPNGAYLLINNKQKLEFCISSLRKAFKTIKDRRRAIWLNNLLRTLERLRKQEPTWQYEVGEIQRRVQHSDLREDYKQFVKNAFAGAMGKKVDRPTINDLRHRLKLKFKLPAEPPADVVSAIVAELDVEQEAKKHAEIEKKARLKAALEEKKRYQMQLADMQSKMEAIKNQRPKEEVPRSQPRYLRVPDLPEIDDPRYIPEQLVEIRKIKSVFVANEPVGTFCVAVMNDARILPLCRPTKNRFRADKVMRFVQEMLSLPAPDEAVDVPQPDEE